ncbi:serine/threonine-protein kinase [Pseudonocardia sp.]|uniref:serine/threonine-protein kinase n=1 Tax=Pseudonocardia sp. TaxID=60912 RepID=UPI003D0D52F9
MTLAPPAPPPSPLVGPPVPAPEIPADDPPALAPGAEIVPGYTVVEHLRRGRDVDTYDAWSVLRHSRCVVKAIRPDLLGDRYSVSLLRREGRLLRSLAHPHLVRAYELVRGDSTRPDALVLEVLSGATLAHLMDELGRLPATDVGHVGRHLCSALHYLHGSGYVHLDVKPSNVIADEGRAKLIDLGLARRPGRCPAGVGTRLYMAPEQAVGGEVGPAADVWGIGLLLYEAATGHHPFLPDDEADLDADPDASDPSTSDDPLPPLQLSRRAPRLRARRRLPRAVAEVIDACLEPDPVRRPTLAELDAAVSLLVPDEDPADPAG